MMNNIKYRQYVGGKFHYWGFLQDDFTEKLCFVGPITNQMANPIHCQFTGLTDKNGVEIYEGDIVKINDGEIIDAIAQTVFHNGSGYMHGCGFYFKRLNKFEDCCLDDDGLVWYAEVVGNIYQNPELLK